MHLWLSPARADGSSCSSEKPKRSRTTNDNSGMGELEEELSCADRGGGEVTSVARTGQPEEGAALQQEQALQVRHSKGFTESACHLGE